MRTHALSPARRIVLAMLSTTSVLALLFGYHTSTAGSLAATTTTTAPAFSGTVAGTSSSGGTSAATAAGTGTGSAVGASSATVSGDAVQTRYGPVQLQLAVSDGTITGVDVLQYPHSSGHDQQINGYALPILIQETLDAQSAQVDMVSGATYTSLGYQQSLQSALDEAGL